MPERNDRESIESVSRIKSKVKIVFLGEQSTGKTSILMRFLNGKFEESQGATVGIDFMGKNFNVNNHHLRLQLWDTAGQERFRSLIPSYLKDAMITMIVFDLTNEKTVENISQWVDLCSHNRNEKNIVVFLGNKLDLGQTREVSKEVVEQKLAKYGKKYFEVSAKTGEGVQEVFNYACGEFIRVNMLEAEMTFSSIHQEMQKRFSATKQSTQSTVNESETKNTKKEEAIKIKKSEVKEKKKKKGCC